MRKPKSSEVSSWTPDENDENFEREGDFFQSGLSDWMPHRNMRPADVHPGRHHCDTPYPDNYINADYVEETAMPFHPTRLEVFKRVSILRAGGVDIDGLTGWWAIDPIVDSDTNNPCNFPRHEDISRCGAPFWRHKRGTEYLAIPQSRYSDTVASGPNELVLAIPRHHSSLEGSQGLAESEAYLDGLRRHSGANRERQGRWPNSYNGCDSG